MSQTEVAQEGQVRWETPVRALLGKELRQLRRSKGALLSATVLPLLLLVLIPLGQVLGMRGAAAGTRLPLSSPRPPSLPPGLASLIQDPVQLVVQVMLPLYVTIGGLVVPSVAAIYTVIAEREKRSLELLMALPARLQEILLAKLLATLVLALIVVVPLFAVDALVLLALRVASPGEVALLFIVLLAALACSIGIALLLALLARDFRTANHLNGALVGPLILLALAILFGVPGAQRLLVLAAALLAAGAGAFWVGARWLTFERYLT